MGNDVQIKTTNQQRRNKAKLAFDLLEKEMEIIYKDELSYFLGGYSSSGGTSSSGVIADYDCYYQSLYYISSQLGCGYTVSQIENWYESYSGTNNAGVASNDFQILTDHFFDGVSAINYSQLQQTMNAGNKVVVTYYNDDGNGHAVVAQQIMSNGDIRCWDQQNRQTVYVKQSELIPNNALVTLSSCGL